MRSRNLEERKGGKSNGFSHAMLQEEDEIKEKGEKEKKEDNSGGDG